MRRLQHRRVREERRRFVVEGPQGVAEALAVPGLVQEWFATPAALASDPRLRSETSPIVVSEDVIRAMAQTRNPQGVVAVCGFLDVGLAEVMANTRPRLVALLWQIRDPGNAGTVLRTADAAGASAVLFSADSVDVYNDKCVRATAGSLFHVPFVREAEPLQAVAQLRTAGMRVLAADGGSRTSLYDLLPCATAPGVLAGPVAWVFGNEARGLDPAIADAADITVSIPHTGPAESLNLAVAAAVCLMTTAAAQAGRIAKR